jgi:hypothetical protein
VLVNRPVEVGPPAGDLHVCLIGEPPVSGRMSPGPGRLDELGREPLDPPIDGDVVHGDAALGQQFLDVPVRQAITQLPTDRDRDHLPRKPVTGEH